MVTRFTVSGTHDRGALMGVAPTGRGSDLHGCRHPPHSGGQDRRGAGLGTSISEVREGFVGRWQR